MVTDSLLRGRMIPALPSLFLSAAALLAANPSARAEASGYLLVANKGDKALSIIDPSTGLQLAEIPEEGVTGHEVAASPDGKLAFVPIYGNSGVGIPGTDGQLIRVIDLDKRAIVGTIDFGKGVRPHCAVFGPKDGLLYVTTELEDCVTVIDPATLKIVGTIFTGKSQSHMLAISPDGTRGYTANVGSGTVSVLDMVARKLITVIPVAKVVQRISVSRDGRWVFTADEDKANPSLVVIDATTNTVSTAIPLPGLAYGTAPTLDGRWLVVTIPGVSQVGLVDLASMSLARTVDVPKTPQEALISPDDSVAYVSCSASRKVAVIDLKSWTVEKLIAAGKNDDGLSWAKAN